MTMYVYLANTLGRVALPSAIGMMSQDDEDGEITFVDEAGRSVAVFRRPDVLMYFFDDHGPSLDEVERAGLA